jgi:hypothetical protein
MFIFFFNFSIFIKEIIAEFLEFTCRTMYLTILRNVLNNNHKTCSKVYQTTANLKFVLYIIILLYMTIKTIE